VKAVKNRFQVSAIGSVQLVAKQFFIQLKEPYIPSLTGLEGFSHLQILWWAHLTDGPQHRENLLAGKLFKKGPDHLGIFATRAPARPNPIMVSTIGVQGIDFQEGIIRTAFMDAADGTPVLDVKPYYPMERVKDPAVPGWCRHWPSWQKEAATFNWSEEINFR
jgi:tRNA (Thr-GGU) A37 N-methylase